MWDAFFCCLQADGETAQLVDVNDKPADTTDGPLAKSAALPTDDTTDRAVVSTAEEHAISGLQGLYRVGSSSSRSKNSSRQVSLEAQLAESSEDDGSDTFHVVTVQDPKGHGLVLDVTDEKVPVVTKISEGAIQVWNSRNAQGRDASVVRIWDGLVRVNGQRGSSKELVSLLQTPGKLELVFRRPGERIVVIAKDKYQPLGMMLETTFNAGLLLAEIQDGVFKTRCPEVQVNERIVVVNGQDGNSADLWDLIEDNDTLTLKLLSYARKP